MSVSSCENINVQLCVHPKQRPRSKLTRYLDSAVADGSKKSGSIQSPLLGGWGHDDPHFALWSMMSHMALPLNGHVFFTTNIKQMMRNLQMMVFHKDKQSKQSLKEHRKTPSGHMKKKTYILNGCRLCWKWHGSLPCALLLF